MTNYKWIDFHNQFDSGCGGVCGCVSHKCGCHTVPSGTMQAANIVSAESVWHASDYSSLLARYNNSCPPQQAQEIIASYVYKQQVYYIKCGAGNYLNWVPLVASDGGGFANLVQKTQYTASVIGAATIPASNQDNPVVYPDYSKTDVGQGKVWPKRYFAPFVDSTAWPPYKIAEMYGVTHVPYYNLGFIVSQSPQLCKPSWGGYYSAEAGPLNDQIKALRALGGDVTVSFGGSANVPIHVTAPDVTSLFTQYKLFVDAYGLRRIDFDLEGIWIDPSYQGANLRNSQALKQLQDYRAGLGSSIDVWFTLPILPTGLTPPGLRILQTALDQGVVLGGVNVMTMDYGDSAAPNPQGKMGQYGIDAITALHAQLDTLYKGSKTAQQLWSMIGTTPMLGVNDVSTEIFAQTDAHQTLSFAQANNIGQISMWSSNRDTTAQSRIPQTDNEFSLIFNAYNS